MISSSIPKLSSADASMEHSTDVVLSITFELPTRHN